MKLLKRICASFLLISVLLSNSTYAYTKRLSRDVLFSQVTYTEKNTVLDNAGGLWRKANNGDEITTFTSSKAISNTAKKKTSPFVFIVPRKNQIYSTEMEVGSGKTYEYSEYIRTNKVSSIIVRIRWDDNTTTRYKVAPLPALTNWNKVNFKFFAPEGAKSFSVIHEMIGVGTIELGTYGAKDLSVVEPVVLKLDKVVVSSKTQTTTGGGGGGGGGGGSVTIGGGGTPSGSGSTGSGSTGSGSTGSGSTGSGSTGSGSETGSGSTGSGSTGSGSTGSGSETGSGSTGSGSTGSGSETGSGSTGSGSTGSGSTGSGSETGSGSTGSGSETGSGSTGSGSTGSGSTGSGSTGSGSTGSGSTGYTCLTTSILNACMEDESSPGIPYGWNQGGFGTNTTIFNYPAEGNHGSGLNLLITAYTDGDSKWFFNDVAATGGTSYAYQVQYKSDAPSKLTVRYTTSTGGFLYDEIANLDPAASWTPVEKVIVAPENTASLTIFHVLAQTGSLSIDEAYLSAGTGATSTGTTPPGITGSGLVGSGSGFPCPTGMNTNPCMEDQLPSGFPNGWNTSSHGTNSPTFYYPVAGKHDRGVNVILTSHTDGEAKWYFDDVSVTSGDQHKYQFEYKSDVATKITARYTTSTGGYVFLDLANLPSASDWTHFEQTVTIPSGIVSMTVFHVLAQVGSLSLDEAIFSTPILYTGTPFSNAMLTFAFDDGWLSQKVNAIPLLDSKGIKGTFGIITNEMLNADLVLPEDQVYMNTQETLAVQTAGHEIASHTKSHANLPTLDASGMLDEIAGSRDVLLGTGFAPVSTIVFPYGEHSPAVDQVSQDAGYTAGRDDAYGYNTKDTAKFALYVQNVGSGTTLSQVQNWVDTAYDNNLWLILMLHQVDNSGFEYAIDPTTFSNIVDYVSAKGIQTVTIGQGVTYMN